MLNATVQQPHADEGADTLRVGTILNHGQYRIESFLVRGSFGVTYAARDRLDRQVLIRECYTDRLCKRQANAVFPATPSSKQEFQRVKERAAVEAKIMARLSCSSVPSVHQIFDQNNTLYIVTDLIVGLDLLDVSIQDPHRLTPMLIRRLLYQALESLSYLHESNVLHRSLSPENFILDDTNCLQIVDFANACDINETQTSIVNSKSRYAPPEYYQDDAHASPQSDIYALGATFYQIITGHPPPDASKRNSTRDPYRPLFQTRRDYDPLFLALIDDALAIIPTQRPQSAAAWLSVILDGAMPTEDRIADNDPEILRVVSTLVAEVNKDMEIAISTPTTAPKKPKRCSMRRLVDVFGEPIDDLDMWIAKQNKKSALQATLAQPVGLLRRLRRFAFNRHS